jgi:uncharacterized protein
MNEIPPAPSPAPAPVPPPAAPPEKDARMWNMFCHLSALAGFIVPLGSILGPLLIWQIKKSEFPSVEQHGKEALNFQISVVIYLFAGAMVALVTSFFCITWLLFPVVAGIGIAAVVLTIIAGLKANEGGFYKYPCTLRLVK